MAVRPRSPHDKRLRVWASVGWVYADRAVALSSSSSRELTEQLVHDTLRPSS